MIIFPRSKPSVQNLNSYFLNIERLFEHYQGELGTGCIYFKSLTSEGVIFFDENNLLNGVYKDKTKIITENKAVNYLFENAASSNFSVSVFTIDSEKVYYWANISGAVDLLTNIKTDFTDIQTVMNQMQNEKLTGYIESSNDNGNQNGVIFYLNGLIVGCLPGSRKEILKSTKADIDQILSDTVKNNSRINVKKVSLNSLPQIDNNCDDRSNSQFSPDSKITHVNIIRLLEELMITFETTLNDSKKNKVSFEILLRKKFMEKIDIYDFLDPFLAEFSYKEGGIDYSGTTDSKKLASGIANCLKEISNEQEISAELKSNLSTWAEKYKTEIKQLGILF